MHLMIDLETLGTNLDCPVISIGAVLFDVSGIKKEFLINLDISEQLERGRKPMGSTIRWWMNQSNAAKKVFSESSVSVISALDKFLDFVVVHPGIDLSLLEVWSNGSNFDIAIMENLYAQYSNDLSALYKHAPWDYRNIRDYRTFKKYNCEAVDVEFSGTAHTPLDDAKHQALVVIAGLKKGLN